MILIQYEPTESSGQRPWDFDVPVPDRKVPSSRLPTATIKTPTLQVTSVDHTSGRSVACVGRIDRSIVEPPCARRCRRTEASWISLGRQVCYWTFCRWRPVVGKVPYGHAWLKASSSRRRGPACDKSRRVRAQSSDRTLGISRGRHYLRFGVGSAQATADSTSYQSSIFSNNLTQSSITDCSRWDR